MILKSSAVAILVSALLSPALHANESLDVVTNIPEYESNAPESNASTTNIAIYNVQLTSPGVLGRNASGENKQAVLNNIDNEQQGIFDLIKSSDQSATLVRSLRLVANTIYVQMNTEAAAQLASSAQIQSITKTKETLTTSSLQQKQLAGKTSYPFLKVNDPGDDPVVAILGQGVDFTHAKLGGGGDIDDYISAFYEKDAVSELFPNNTVIGGFDFKSSRTGFDYNPLEFYSDINLLQPDGITEVSYTAGVGTVSASMVLSMAPSAKILSYKISGVFQNGRGIYPEDRDAFLSALEFVVDPNQDGNMSDAADIVLIDNSVYGFMGYYNEADVSTSAYTNALRVVASAGILVVSPAGANGQFQTFYSAPGRAITPEGISVGYVKPDEDQANLYNIDPESPIGPSRGSHSFIKPELVASNTDAFGATVFSGNGWGKVEDNNLYAAARVAGIAASLKSSNPNLLAHEIKAIITNSADYDVLGAWGVAQMGAGSLDQIGATSVPAFIYEKATLQPTINFGQVRLSQRTGYTRELTVKNISNKEQTYNIGNNFLFSNNDNKNYQALDVVAPAQVTVPAQSEVTIAFTIYIDPSLLDEMSIKQGSDFTVQNWHQYALDGYLLLTHTVNEDLSIKMPWLVMPSKGQVITNVEDSFQYETLSKKSISNELVGNSLPFGNAWRDYADLDVAVEYYQFELENSSDYAQDLFLLPTMYYAPGNPKEDTQSFGHQIKSIAADVLSEDSCTVSGKKLTVAVTMFDKFNLPVSRYLDRQGDKIYSLKMYTESALTKSNGQYRTPKELATESSAASRITELSVYFDFLDIGEDGIRGTKDDSSKPLTIDTFFVDHGFKYTPYYPLARIKKTSLPTIASPNGRTVISQICLEDMYHAVPIERNENGTEPVQDIPEESLTVNSDTFNKDIGFIFQTDRQSVPSINDDLLIQNFLYDGLKIEHRASSEEVRDEIEPEIEECDEFNEGDPLEWINDDNGNCIRLFKDNYPQISLSAYLELTSPFNISCIETDEHSDTGEYICTYSNDRLVTDIVIENSPSNETVEINLWCDFSTDSVYAMCYPALVAEGQGNIYQQSDYEIGLRVDQLLQPPGVGESVFGSGDYSLLTGSYSKMAIIEEKLDIEDDIELLTNLNWQPGQMTMEAGQSVVIGTLRQQACEMPDSTADCLKGVSVINPATGYVRYFSAYSDFGYINDQHFSAASDAKTGEVIGKIVFETESAMELSKLQTRVISSDINNPFQITDEGVVSIKDASLLNSGQSIFQMTVQLYRYQHSIDQATITIGISSTNKHAPELVDTLPEIISKVGEELDTVNVANSFSDLDGGVLTYRATGLPSGLTLTPTGLLNGTPTENSEGNYSVEITVSDGLHNYKADLTVDVLGVNASVNGDDSSSGGSFPFALISLMFLVFNRRFWKSA